MKTFIRRLAILDYLRASRVQKSTDEILNHLLSSDYFESYGSADTLESLSDSNYSAIRRTIQRDLNFLYGANDVLKDEGDNEFGLEAERGSGKSLLWSLDPYSTLAYDFEKMPTYLALSFAMTQKHLSGIMPKNTLTEMARFFKDADSKLQKEASKVSPQQFGRLKDSVEFYQRGQRLQAANYDITVLDTIYRAILKEKQLNIHYRGKAYRVHPFGVVILLPKLYLVAKKHEDINKPNEYRHFLIHKIDQIEVATYSSNVPDRFNLATYLDEGNMDVMIDYQDKALYQLVLRFNIFEPTNLMADLAENPISHDQSLVKISPSIYELTASVKRTVQLKNWIMGLGRVATVIKPSVIRNDIISELKALSENYTGK
ncbi:helix-turn-helix transcriptional regulator [Alkalimarinus alittae]|uniref:WYL domain-containing protein n=1 Tax=Alkalimarinus alittae TaxID=2961619 RepID=A0ABY6MXR1_9ALTE|nr:WYL domain-containing protein [Alkalimarinus alittae]UZE94616.1 WYL domain-containing protein [Alkalimarinus alittae]